MQALLTRAAVGDVDIQPVFHVSRTWEEPLTARYRITLLDGREGRVLAKGPVRVAIPGDSAEAPAREVRALPAGSAYEARVTFPEPGWARVVVSYMGETMTFAAFDEQVPAQPEANAEPRTFLAPGVSEEEYEERRLPWMDPHVARFGTRDRADLWGIFTHAGWSFVMMAALLSLRRTVRRDARRALRDCQVLWAALVVLLLTGVYNWVWNTPGVVPVPLTSGHEGVLAALRTTAYGEPYALLLFVKHVLIVMLLLGTAALTKLLRGRAASSAAPSPFGASLAALNLALGAAVVVLGVALGFVHRVSH